MTRVVTIPLHLAASYIPAELLAFAETQWQQTAQEAVSALDARRLEYVVNARLLERQARYQPSYALVEAYRGNASDDGVRALAVEEARDMVAKLLGVTR